MNVSGEPLLPPLDGLRALFAGNGDAGEKSDVQLFGYARQALAAGGLPVYQDLSRHQIEFMADTVTALGVANA